MERAGDVAQQSIPGFNPQCSHRRKEGRKEEGERGEGGRKEGKKKRKREGEREGRKEGKKDYEAMCDSSSLSEMPALH